MTYHMTQIRLRGGHSRLYPNQGDSQLEMSRCQRIEGCPTR